MVSPEAARFNRMPTGLLRCCHGPARRRLRSRHDADRHRAGLRGHAHGPRRRARGRVPDRRDGLTSGPAARPPAARPPARGRPRRGRRPLPRALPRPRHRADVGVPGCPRGALGRTPPRRPDRAGHREVRTQRPAPRRPPRLRHRPPRGLGLGRRQGRRAARRGRQHLRRRPRPRRRGRTRGRRHQRLGADRRVHPRRAGGGGHRRRARRPHQLPGLAGRAPPRPPARPRSRSTCARSGSVLVAFSGGADSAFLLAAAVRALGADHVAAATAYSASLPQAERDPARAFAEDARGPGADAGDARDGARGLPRQRRRPLLLLQGRAARRTHSAGGRPRAGGGRHRHQRRRRPRRLPAGDPAPRPSGVRRPR